MLRRALVSLTLGTASFGCFVDRPGDGTIDLDTATDTSTGSTSLLTTSASTTGATTSTSTTGATTNDATSEVDTSGGPAGPLDDACATFCTHAARCDAGTEAACLATCAPLLLVDVHPSDACVVAALDLLECLSAATCEALIQPEVACPEAYMAQTAACPPCEATVDPVMGGTCVTHLTCQVDVYEVKCGANQCSCLVNGVVEGSCTPGADPCAGTDDARIDGARTCCDWPA